MRKINFPKRISSPGSALILAVVLTSMLAVIGTIFLMTARIDSMATSGIAENKELDFAVRSIVDKISHELILDTPGVADGQEYYDYPDVNNPWLASLEPYEDGVDEYKWRQISDVTGFLDRNDHETRDIIADVDPGNPDVVKEYPVIELDNDGLLEDTDGHANADADGDGIADAKWIELDNISSTKGKKIYAAVRVIDNSGMLNVNTAYEFDSDETDERRRIDGTRQHQIDLASLSEPYSSDNIDDVTKTIHDSTSLSISALEKYYNEYIICPEDPNIKDFKPFDMLDELELRYRFCITGQAQTRLETTWPDTIDGEIDSPYDTSTSAYDPNKGLDDWFENLTLPDPDDSNAPDIRHLLTTYNTDRIINPNGGKMVNLNIAGGEITGAVDPNLADKIYEAVRNALGSDIGRSDDIASLAGVDVDAMAAQIAVNIIDYSDYAQDRYEEVTRLRVDGDSYYGFERPIICISELAYKFYKEPIDPLDPGAADPNVYRSYGIELYKRYGDEQFDDWQLVIEPNNPNRSKPKPFGITIPINSSDFAERGGRYYVLLFEDETTPVTTMYDEVKWIDSPADGATGVDPEVELSWPRSWLEPTDPNDSGYRNWTFNVYFGTDEDPLFYDHLDVDANVISIAPLMVPNQTYYWRIEDVNESGIVQRPGKVWSFETGAPKPNVFDIDPNTIVFDVNTTITLQRYIDSQPVVIDSVTINSNDANDPFNFGLDVYDTNPYSKQRDTQRGLWIKQLWNPEIVTPPTLGSSNTYHSGSGGFIPAWPKNRYFTNIGELGQIFRDDVYNRAWNKDDTEADVKIDLADPNFQQLFKYLTVMDPNDDGFDNDGDGEYDELEEVTPEWKIAGRININTAPAYVISKLPWVSQDIAEAIVAYRDKTDSPAGVDYSGSQGRYGKINTLLDIITPFDQNDIRLEPGFENIGELNFVIAGADDESIRYYSVGAELGDLIGFPDLTFRSRSRSDGVTDDFEERDMIFTRISDLVTVRSDVFTAYILVRIGIDGPQKRYIAILDRSNVYSASDKVKIRALQPVPDPK